jgi:molybdopterin synthase catalytic subunit
MSDKKTRNIFMQGAIPSIFIAESIEKHSSNKLIGGHSIFLGQVRAD